MSMSRNNNYGRQKQHNKRQHGMHITSIKDAKEDTKKSQGELDKMCISFWNETPYVPVMGKQHELEIKFSTMRNSPRVTRTDYDNVLKQLLSLGFTSKNMRGEYMLRINNEYLDATSARHKMSNIRTEVSGFSAVQEYCKTNDIVKLLNDPLYSRSVSMQKKYKAPSSKENEGKEGFIESVDFRDFDFRASYNVEETFNTISRTGLVKSTVDNWNKSKKTFRYLNRITLTHEDYPVKVDISIVKSSKIIRGGMERTYTTTESNVFYANENYEIEIEVDNSMIGPNTKYTDIKAVMESLKKVAKFVMMGLQETKFPVSKSEYNNIKSQYLKLIQQDPEYNLESKHFVGPSSYTLQLSHIQEVDEENTEPNIRTGYTVTDKADGERRIMFITHTGHAYLINTNMKLLFTGAKTSNEKYFNTLLDGEIILHDKNGKYINLYAVFDVYFINKIDVRSHLFAEPNIKDVASKKDDKKSRFNLMNEVVNNLNLHSVVKDTNTPIRISVKTFHVGTDTYSIFSGCSTILKRIDDGLFEYNTDGLIFTPANLGVGSNIIGEAGPLRKITWEHSFKWKPSEFNTIDFMVTTVKNDRDEDVVNTMFEQGVNAATSSQYKEYKVLTLRCGFDEKVHGYINPCQDVLNDTIPSYRDERGENTTGYHAMQFIPTNPYQEDAGICNLMLAPDANGDNKMYTEEKDVIEDNTIVEFSYDSSRENGWNWVPLRVRYDKTSELRRGVKNFGNAYHVANSNWHSIHYPVTAQMIRTGQNIPEDTRDDDVYYKKTKGVSYTYSLRDFHNLYVKSKLINGVSDKKDTLIDFACGKGGDLPKWIKAKLSFVFGIDLSPDNIENRLDGACARYLNYKKTTKNIPNALFVIGNSEYNIRSGQAIETDKGKQITASVFGNNARDEKLGKGVVKSYAIGEEGFNISSCQFALHYFFKDKHVLHRFLANIAECTKIGGHFIGACYDGSKIFNLLKDKDLGQEVELYHKNKKIWGVKKLFPEDTFEDNVSSLGYTIKVFQESINNYIDEYLVNFDYFTRMMINYGFQVVNDRDAEDMGFPSGSASFETLYNRMNNDFKKNPRMTNDYGQASKMQSYEKTISFNNRYFIFKKISNVNVDNVLRNEKNNIEEDSIKQEIDKQVITEEKSEKTSEKKKTLSKSDTVTKTGKKTVIRRPKKLNQTITLMETSSESK
jgi:hypothetical protein|uniref:mRNA (guanine-N(7))-methyltransferase n=1 Tax=viral metagenome TaxID=1070528 RepID=A0A6C0IN82_9ZZZZ